MKAINPTGNHKGDDAYFDRLLSYFQSHFQDEIIQLKPIQKSVFLLKTTKDHFMMKGYHSNRRLRLQEAFTATLRKEGFLKTYIFLNPPVKEQLFFEGTYFGCMEYIQPNTTAFSFHTQHERKEGLDLVAQFHQTTASFETRYRTLVPKGNIIEKWKERIDIFIKNSSSLHYFMNESIVSELISWGNWSIKGMDQNRRFFNQEPFVILHGDLAHHNFLRDRNGELHLIDFDLISIGPPSHDYLQYANRILPYLDWSMEKLTKLNQFRTYLHEEAFLYALAYPADIYREWNRLIRDKSYTSQSKVKQVMDLTLGQFSKRKKFVGHLQELVK